MIRAGEFIEMGGGDLFYTLKKNRTADKMYTRRVNCEIIVIIVYHVL